MSRLTKEYRGVKAVDNLSFVVKPGRVTRFPRSLRCREDDDAAHVPRPVEADVGNRHHRRRSATPTGVSRFGRVGGVLEAGAAHKGRTGRDHLRIICQSAGIPLARGGRGPGAGRALPWLAAGTFGGYSLGMRQRLGVAAALLGDPQGRDSHELANGLDPEGIPGMRNLLRTLAAHGRTVLVSSHLLAEMEQLADDLIIIAAGQLAARGTVAAIVSSMTHRGRTLVRTPRRRNWPRSSAATPWSRPLATERRLSPA